MGPADRSFCRLHFGLARQAVEIVIVGAALIEIEKDMISKVCGANATFIVQGGRTLHELMLHKVFERMINPMCINTASCYEHQSRRYVA